jgi:hypothetical protein
MDMNHLLKTHRRKVVLLLGVIVCVILLALKMTLPIPNL